MADMTMVLITTRVDTGETVEAGDMVTNFRGDTATFVRADRARVPGKSGMVEGRTASGERRWLYDNVFGLRVDGLLRCGCPHWIVWTDGHQEGCTRRTCTHPDVRYVPDAGNVDAPEVAQCFTCGEHL